MTVDGGLKKWGQRAIWGVAIWGAITVMWSIVSAIYAWAGAAMTAKIVQPIVHREVTAVVDSIIDTRLSHSTFMLSTQIAAEGQIRDASDSLLWISFRGMRGEMRDTRKSIDSLASRVKNLDHARRR